MQKIAQRRGVLNRLREMVNAPLGGAAEKFFNPQFNEVMEKLRETDANARSIVAGKSLEKGDPGNDPIAFKDLLNSAKSNLNRREFMAAVADLSRFHRRIALLLAELGKFDSKIDEIHHQFLVKDVGDEHLDEIRGLKGRLAYNKQQADLLVKEAGAISDFLKSWSDPRGRALRFYEKRYEKRVKPLRDGVQNSIRDGEKLLGKILIHLKEMATARATRNPDKYSEGIGKIKGAYDVYNAAFKGFYNNTVKKLEHLIPEKPSAAEEIPTTEQAGAEEVDNRDTSITPPPLPSSPPSSSPPSGQPASGNPSVEPPTESGEFGHVSIPAEQTPSVPANSSMPINLLNPIFPKDPKLPSGVGLTPPPPAASRTQTMLGVAPDPNKQKTQTIGYSSAHANFYASLETMSGEHPRILANFISKYAQSIQQTDPTTAIKLLQIAKSVRG